MMGTGVHSVDLLRFVLGAEVDEITAVTDGQTAARPLEQLACLTLRFGNGTLGQVVASRLLPDSRNDFRVYGITGLIAGHHSMWEARTGRFEITSDTVNETADYPEALLPNYVAEIEDFQRAVATGDQPAATGLDGLRVVEVTLAMIESARTHRSVKIERVEP
jgi:predicted dehydrogenase